MCHFFSVLTVTVVFLAPLTLIPRTNSILYQSYWFELNLAAIPFILVPAASEVLNVATFFEEKTLLSFRMLSKMYSLLVLAWIVPYLIAYLIWCQYLKNNWPIPFLVSTSLSTLQNQQQYGHRFHVICRKMRISRKTFKSILFI